MAKPKNTGLGRGLDAIFMENSVDESGSITMLRLSEIEPNPTQPRREFDEVALEQLADSIATHGLIQPIVVRSANTSGYYQIIAGERRWRASKMAGLTEVPVIVMELDDKKAAQIALIENIQRESLNPIEEATAYRALMEDYGMTQEEVSKQIGKSRSAVANTLRLLELPSEVTEMVSDGRISAGHAKALLGLKNSARITAVAYSIIAKAMSVREAERLVKHTNRLELEAKRQKQLSENQPSVNYTFELAKKMTQKLGRRVVIRKSAIGGTLELSFETDSDLDGLVTKLCGNNVFDD